MGVSFNSTIEIIRKFELNSKPTDFNGIRRELKDLYKKLHPDATQGEFQSEEQRNTFREVDAAKEFVETLINSSFNALIPVEQLPILLEKILELPGRKPSKEEKENEVKENFHSATSRRYGSKKITSAILAGVFLFLLTFGERMGTHWALQQLMSRPVSAEILNEWEGIASEEEKLFSDVDVLLRSLMMDTTVNLQIDYSQLPGLLNHGLSFPRDYTITSVISDTEIKRYEERATFIKSSIDSLSSIFALNEGYEKNESDSRKWSTFKYRASILGERLKKFPHLANHSLTKKKEKFSNLIFKSWLSLLFLFGILYVIFRLREKRDDEWMQYITSKYGLSDVYNTLLRADSENYGELRISAESLFPILQKHSQNRRIHRKIDFNRSNLIADLIVDRLNEEKLIENTSKEGFIKYYKISRPVKND